jgi:hypothetical protein
MGMGLPLGAFVRQADVLRPPGKIPRKDATIHGGAGTPPWAEKAPHSQEHEVRERVAGGLKKEQGQGQG